jgi:hypothetical protein
MNEQQTLANLIAAIQEAARASIIDDEFIRRFREEFDRAERAKAENNRRLEVRLAELRAQRAAL